MTSWSSVAPSTSTRPSSASHWSAARSRTVSNVSWSGISSHRFFSDQRRGDSHGDDGRAGRVRLELQVARHRAGEPAPQPAATGDGAVERGVDEHPAGALGQSTSDIRVAADDAGDRVDGESAVAGDVVEDEVGVLAGEGEPQDRGVVGRRDLGDDTAREPHAVVVRAGLLVGVPEGELSLAAPRARLLRGDRREHLEGLPVTHPRAGQVARGQRLERRQVLVVVVPVIAVEPTRRAGVGDRGPEGEPVRDGGGGDGVAA